MLKKNISLYSLTKIKNVKPDDAKFNSGNFNYISSSYKEGGQSIPRFVKISTLSDSQRAEYKQLQYESIRIFRENLIGILDEDVKIKMAPFLNDAEQFGLLLTKVDTDLDREFMLFFNEVIHSDEAVITADYTKIDFGAQKIWDKILDPRCINAKLNPLQIFLAAFQVGSVPGVANYRLLINPKNLQQPSKYREYKIHFDNSNFDTEFKQIVTRNEEGKANSDQYLAVFVYDTKNYIRYTREEFATKFQSIEELQVECAKLGMEDVRYCVMKSNDDCPVCTGINTDLLPHHRSPSMHSETRLSDLLTWHAVRRCKPFMTKDQLSVHHKVPELIKFVLGEFNEYSFQNEAEISRVFNQLMQPYKNKISNLLRNLLENNKFMNFQDSVVAKLIDGKFKPDQDKTDLWDLQYNGYANLPDIKNSIPCKLDRKDINQVKHWILKILTYDQNSGLSPDCFELNFWQARVQIRERSKDIVWNPIYEDLSKVEFSFNTDLLFSIEFLQNIAEDISHFNNLLEQKAILLKDKLLFEQRSFLALDYRSQLKERCPDNETHQSILLFMYLMIDDISKNIQFMCLEGQEKANCFISTYKVPLLQHLVTFKLLSDRNKILDHDLEKESYYIPPSQQSMGGPGFIRQYPLSANQYLLMPSLNLKVVPGSGILTKMTAPSSENLLPSSLFLSPFMIMELKDKVDSFLQFLNDKFEESDNVKKLLDSYSTKKEILKTFYGTKIYERIDLCGSGFLKVNPSKPYFRGQKLIVPDFLYHRNRNSKRIDSLIKDNDFVNLMNVFKEISDLETLDKNNRVFSSKNKYYLEMISFLVENGKDGSFITQNVFDTCTDEEISHLQFISFAKPPLFFCKESNIRINRICYVDWKLPTIKVVINFENVKKVKRLQSLIQILEKELNITVTPYFRKSSDALNRFECECFFIIKKSKDALIQDMKNGLIRQEDIDCRPAWYESMGCFISDGKQSIHFENNKDFYYEKYAANKDSVFKIYSKIVSCFSSLDSETLY